MKRIIIIKPSSMGDIIHGLLVAESIRNQMPGVSIDWVVRREFAPLIEASAAVEKCFIFERKGGLRGFIRLLKELREEPCDAVLDMQGLARSGLMALATRATLSVGRFDAREGAKWCCRKRTAKPEGKPPWHAVAILAGFLPALGLEKRIEAKLTFKAPANSVEGMLPDLSEGQKRVIVFPESRRAEKNWSGYEALTRSLLQHPAIGQVVWCGHVAYAPDGDIAEAGFVNLTAKTSIDALPTILEAADCVVSNDSGPMHLAAALGRPLVVLFGPTSPEQFGPYPRQEDKQRIITPDGGDLSAVEVGEVVDAVNQVLNIP